MEEDAAIEVTAAEGGYGRKQLFELIQNAADALRGAAGPHPGDPDRPELVRRQRRQTLHASSVRRACWRATCLASPVRRSASSGSDSSP